LVFQRSIRHLIHSQSESAASTQRRLTVEQKLRHEDYHIPAQRLIAQARHRPLTKEEFDRLQQLLACMRMICDTPATLDRSCRISPKIEELEGILEDLLEDPERKIIVFSEWERMLALVRDLARKMGVDAAWHTGSTPQRLQTRRDRSFQMRSGLPALSVDLHKSR
jgi:SNF2 family DNA or RNA helicase